MTAFTIVSLCKNYGMEINYLNNNSNKSKSIN
jgi:hypothetical protein